MPVVVPKWVRLSPNRQTYDIFITDSSTFWLPELLARFGAKSVIPASRSTHDISQGGQTWPQSGSDSQYGTNSGLAVMHLNLN